MTFMELSRLEAEFSVDHALLERLNPAWVFYEWNLHFDNEYDIDMSSKNYDETGYGLDLNLVTISH